MPFFVNIFKLIFGGFVKIRVEFQYTFFCYQFDPTLMLMLLSQNMIGRLDMKAENCKKKTVFYKRFLYKTF